MNDNIDIMDRLKNETRSLHDEAEAHPFQKSIVKAKLSRERYVAYLSAMFHVHRGLESCLCRAGQASPVVRDMEVDSRFRENLLRQDLHHFKVDADAVAEPDAVTELRRTLEDQTSKQPAALLGHLYVLEGSTNGSRFVARAVRRAYGLSGREGTRYLDPYGDQQPAEWARFKEQMRAARFSRAQADSIVEAAKMMFRGVMAVCDDLMEVPASHVSAVTLSEASPATSVSAN